MSKNKKVRRAIKEIMDDKSVDDKDPKGSIESKQIRHTICLEKKGDRTLGLMSRFVSPRRSRFGIFYMLEISIFNTFTDLHETTARYTVHPTSSPSSSTNALEVSSTVTRDPIGTIRTTALRM